MARKKAPAGPKRITSIKAEWAATVKDLLLRLEVCGEGEEPTPVDIALDAHTLVALQLVMQAADEAYPILVARKVGKVKAVDMDFVSLKKIVALMSWSAQPAPAQPSRFLPAGEARTSGAHGG